MPGYLQIRRQSLLQLLREWQQGHPDLDTAGILFGKLVGAQPWSDGMSGCS